MPPHPHSWKAPHEPQQDRSWVTLEENQHQGALSSWDLGGWSEGHFLSQPSLPEQVAVLGSEREKSLLFLLSHLPGISFPTHSADTKYLFFLSCVCTYVHICVYIGACACVKARRRTSCVIPKIASESSPPSETVSQQRTRWPTGPRGGC